MLDLKKSLTENRTKENHLHMFILINVLNLFGCSKQNDITWEFYQNSTGEYDEVKYAALSW